MLTQFMPIQASVKGISGTSVAIQGMGQHQLTLKSDNNYKMTIHVDAVFVPSSPYNIIPPQLLISALKTNGYKAGTATHDNKLYTFTCNKDKKNHQLTVRTNENDYSCFIQPRDIQNSQSTHHNMENNGARLLEQTR